MRSDYAFDKKHINQEVMALVDALHFHGIPVLLDVVFNHGGELWVKAWGKNVVYRKYENGEFCEGSGCGPTIRTEHPHIREMIIETLLQLVEVYRFDGFRFDLGALHDKKTMLEIDRRLPKHVYLIAEPWALGGTKWGKGDLHGALSHTRWAVWNDDFREPARTFVKGQGDHHNRDRLMTAIVGNNIKDGSWAVRPQQCVNYLSCHDGQTLADQLGGDKHRVFLGVILLLTSQGIPMLGEGTEMLYSKQGHDNSYNRPDLNQLDWNSLKKNLDLAQAIARLIKMRKQLDHFRYTGHLRVNNQTNDLWDIDWIYPTGYPHHDNVNAIGFVLRRPSRDTLWHQTRDPLIVFLNGSNSGVRFHLPKGHWKVLVDGYHLRVNEFGISNIPSAQDHYFCHAGTGAILSRTE
jgi:pullulanase